MSTATHRSYSQSRASTQVEYRAGSPAEHFQTRTLSPETAGTIVACLLGWFPDDADQHVPVLLDLVRTEASPDVAANTIVSLGLLAEGLSDASGAEAIIHQFRIHLDSG